MAVQAARPALALTVGEPAGIGPEIAIRAAWALRASANCVLVGDAAFLALTASLIDPAIRLSALSTQALRNGGLPHFGPERIAVVDVPLAAHVAPGKLDRENGRAVLATLDLAIEGVQAGWFDAIVTAPLQKSTINDAGVAFSGHTEFLAEKTNTPQVVMMLAGQPAGEQPYLRVALATTHLPLKEVPGAITQDGLARVLDILQHDLKTKFGIAAPRI
ncbi:MAG TPA: 4-hydroxythreonine-4-phosphate dehydrogenase, partial [Massilia sp.]|nr:4-hydroxythreonine-4-phosphate dehydrogenase [Massilia sp.]